VSCSDVLSIHVPLTAETHHLVDEAVLAAMARLCAENAVALARGELPPSTVNPEAWADR